MIYVYCRRGSDGARSLANALEGQRLRKFDGMDFWRKGKRFHVDPDSTIICWGDRLPEIEGVKIVNSENEVRNKLDELKYLSYAGIPVVPVSNIKPKAGIGPDWLPRCKHHIGGNDLLNPNKIVPDFWVQKLDFTSEYRIHSFQKKSIRAGVKVPRAGFVVAPTVEEYEANLKLPNVHPGKKQLAHPWIRSYDAGWKVDYNAFASSKVMRSLAHKAVSNLGLEFGAVDIGEQRNRLGLVVLEVNRAPGIEDGSVEAYARAIRRMLRREAPEGEE